jgi:hypothetical protein
MPADPVVLEAEPWLRGPLEGVHPVLMPTLHAFAQVREDLDRWTDGLTDQQIWLRPHGIAPVGFQLRHIAGSIKRLTAYLQGRPLTADELDEVRREMDPGATRSALLDDVRQSLDQCERTIRSLRPAMLDEPRFVGRRKLPTTVIGLVVHLAEHTQRHVGQLIVTAKIVRTT